MNPRDAARDPAPLATAPAGPVSFGPYLLDAAEARLTRDGAALALSGRPLAVLALLAAHPGRLLDKDTVLDAVWGHRHVSESVLKGAVNTLRTVLGDDARTPRYVETVSRRGYRFIAALQAAVTGSVAETAAVPEPAPAPAPGPAPGRSGNLPPPAAPLIGRDHAFDALAGLLAQHRLVTLTGLGGVGKTRLALAVATEQPAPRDGRWLLRLESLAEPELLRPTLAQTLALGPGAAASDEALARTLAPLELLLLIDNAEHLAEPLAALLAPLLAAAPGLRLLVTSQVPLRLAGEQVLPLAPLALPAALEQAAPPPDSYAAAQLFCERVRQARPGWVPGSAEHADIAAICRALDGVPLALELAAARVALLGTAGVRARLDQRFALLTRGPRDAAARHRTLSAALDWTCSLLAPAEREALRRLAVFAGPFTPAAAQALLATDGGGDGDLDTTLEHIEGLRERSLLVVETDSRTGTTLRLYDSVRRHALDGLAATGTEAEARAAHLRWMRDEAEQAESDEFHGRLQDWMPARRAQLDDLRAALRHGLREGATPAEQADALQLLAASPMLWSRLGLRSEGARWFATACALLAAGGKAEPMRLRHARGVFASHSQLGAPAEALALLRESRPALVAACDRRREYQSLYAECMLLLRLGSRADEAGAQHARMAELFAPDWGALAHRYLGMLEAFAARDRGDIAGYAARTRAMIERCRAAGGVAENWPAENALAQALWLQGRLDEACDQLARTVAELRAAGQLREQVPTLAVAACLHLCRGADTTALALGREAASLLAADRMVWWMADALPWAAWHAGRTADAARLQGFADVRVRQRGDRRGPVFTRLRDGLVNRLTEAGLAPDEAAGALLDDDSAVALAFEA